MKEENLSKVYNHLLSLKKRIEQIIERDFKADVGMGDIYQRYNNLSAFLHKNLSRVMPVSIEKKIQSDNNLYWLINPVDNTNSFFRGLRDYSINITLCQNNLFLMGITYFPLLKTWSCFNYLDVPTINQTEYKLSSVDNLKNSTIAFMGNTMPIKNIDTNMLVTNSLSYACLLLALGKIDAVIASDVNHASFAYAYSIIDSIGGKITNWQDVNIKIPKDFESLVFSNSLVHPDIIKNINSFY